MITLGNAIWVIFYFIIIIIPTILDTIYWLIDWFPRTGMLCNIKQILEFFSHVIFWLHAAQGNEFV